MKIAGISLELQPGTLADFSFRSHSGRRNTESCLVEGERAVATVIVRVDCPVDRIGGDDGCWSENGEPFLQTKEQPWLRALDAGRIEALREKSNGASGVSPIGRGKKDGRARFTPHTSFDDPATPPGAAPRQSIEARSLAFF